ncbi:MAG: hypothetical protein ABIS92_16845 [Polyangia bacterium]
MDLRAALIGMSFLIIACTRAPVPDRSLDAHADGVAASGGTGFMADGPSVTMDGNGGGAAGTATVDAGGGARADADVGGSRDDAAADTTPDVGPDPTFDATSDTSAGARNDATVDMGDGGAPADARTDVPLDGTSPPGDPAKLAMFYLDITAGRVMTSNVQNPKPRVLVASAGQGPDGVAVDMAGGHVYWTGMGAPAADDGFIMRSDLDGTNVKTVVPPGGTYTPKQLKLDRAGGKLYWSDREGMRVQRANLDGSNVESLIIVATGDKARMDATNWCVGVGLDIAGGWIYWSQKGTGNGVGSLRRAPLAIPAGQTAATRTDIQIIYQGLPEPIDIDVDVTAGDIYWTDRGDDTVNRAPIAIPTGFTAATRRDRQILVRGVREAIGVTLDLPRKKAYYTSGANGDLGRVNLDGTGNEPLIPKAGNLTGIALGELP